MFNKLLRGDLEEEDETNKQANNEQVGGSSSSQNRGPGSPNSKDIEPTEDSLYIIPSARRILKLVNDLRVERNLNPLKTHKGLCKASETHAGKMSECSAPFSHENALVRINEAGDFEGCGENLARLENYALDDVPDAAVNGWINSPGHYRNMILPEFNVCGIGVSTYYRKRAVQNNPMFISDDIEGTITFVTMLFGCEREGDSGGLADRLNLPLCTCSLLGVAVLGPIYGLAAGAVAGTVVNKTLGVTPKGLSYCMKEWGKREVLGCGRIACTICETRPAKYEM